jgi:plasmid stabilization system protein ParE
MALEVFWLEFAESKLETIFKFYKDRVNVAFSQKLVNDIVDATIKLQKHPELGQIELNLEHRKEQFRYIVHKNYKIVYWINAIENRIEIAHVFDTRQNPTKIGEL